MGLRMPGEVQADAALGIKKKKLSAMKQDELRGEKWRGKQ